MKIIKRKLYDAKKGKKSVWKRNVAFFILNWANDLWCGMLQIFRSTEKLRLIRYYKSNILIAVKKYAKVDINLS